MVAGRGPAPRAGRPQRGLDPEGCGPSAAITCFHVPPGVRGAPLLVVLHGSRGDGAGRCAASAATASTGWRAQEGFLVASPGRLRGPLNDCRKAASYSARLRDVDDVVFLPRAGVARLAQEYRVDPQRVYGRRLLQWRPDGSPGRRSTGVAGGDRNGGGEPADHGERCLSAGRAGRPLRC